MEIRATINDKNPSLLIITTPMDLLVEMKPLQNHLMEREREPQHISLSPKISPALIPPVHPSSIRSVLDFLKILEDNEVRKLKLDRICERLYDFSKKNRKKMIMHADYQDMDRREVMTRIHSSATELKVHHLQVCDTITTKQKNI